MDTAKKFSQLYSDVACYIEKTLVDIENIHVEHDEGKIHLDKMKSHFKELQSKFNSKLSFLEEHAEWDKFTLAFFGETNAGKSTILESLRILFNEDSRREYIESNQDDLEVSKKELDNKLGDFYLALTDIYNDFYENVESICISTKALKLVMDEESVARLKLEREESDNRLKLERAESETRLQILREQTAKKMRLKLVGVATIAFAIGAGFVTILPLVVR
jgi:predicted ATPase